MSQIATVEKEKFDLTPRNFDEAMKFSEFMAKSSLVPKDFKDKPGDILIAVQMGAELGLQPLQALQNIAVINGRPSVWGDSMLAIIKAHPKHEYVKEVMIGEGMARKAACTMKREGEPEHTIEFSVEDAKRAGLWEKAGPWTSYPDRMLQMRARGFCGRDKFPDALRGLITAEEAQDIPLERVVDITPRDEPVSKLESIKNKLGITHQPSEDIETLEDIETFVPTIESLLIATIAATSKEDLMEIKKHAKGLNEHEKARLRETYNKKNKELTET